MTKFQKSQIVYFSLVLACLGMSYVYWWILLGVISIVYAVLLFVLSLNIRFNFFLEAIHSMPDEKIMLTFDDGPHPEYTPKILDILKEHDVKAMFFVVGEKVELFPDIVKRMDEEGHLIGGHSYSHPVWFGALFGKKLAREIQQAQNLIGEIVEKKIIWFRPPVGVTNPNIARRVKKNDLKVLGWNLRSYDTASTSSDKIIERVKRKLKPGNIVLLHDSVALTCLALPQIITDAKERGYKFDLLNK